MTESRRDKHCVMTWWWNKDDDDDAVGWLTTVTDPVK